jgi:hypothetical protein
LDRQKDVATMATYDTSVPNEMTYVTEHGVIRKSCCVGFSMPPAYFHDVVEKGERFTSSHKNIRQAYREWVADNIKKNEPIKMLVD